MMRFSLLMVLGGVLLPALVAAGQTATDPAETNAAHASVAGTTWISTDSDGEQFEYYFNKDGALYYTRKTMRYTDGHWKQTGNTIYMEINKKFSERVGQVSGAHMEGKGSNRKGDTWTWVAEQKKTEEDIKKELHDLAKDDLFKSLDWKR